MSLASEIEAATKEHEIEDAFRATVYVLQLWNYHDSCIL